MSTHPHDGLPELWMELDDKRRKRLATLMEIHEVSPKRLAIAVGWKSRTSITRLLNGEYNAVDTDRAARIAHFFGVPQEHLFLPKSSSGTRDSEREAS